MQVAWTKACAQGQAKSNKLIEFADGLEKKKSVMAPQALA
jgi:hypothetical protein